MSTKRPEELIKSLQAKTNTAKLRLKSRKNDGHLSSFMKKYLSLNPELQTLISMGISVSGHLLPKDEQDGYVFQMSHGKQQIKKYEPEKYKNHITTPLRARTRYIVKLAFSTPGPDIKSKLKKLYRTFPFYLLKSEPVNLRLKNFRFVKKAVPDSPLKIYRASDPKKAKPETDVLLFDIAYLPKKTITFKFDSLLKEYYYAVNTTNNEISNILKFFWLDELPAHPGEVFPE